MQLIKHIKKAIQSGNLPQKVFCYMLCRLGYSDELLRRVELRNKYLKKLRKQYQAKLNSLAYERAITSGVKSDKVWVCWFQGLENAPSIIKKCVRSIEKYAGRENVTIITKENMGSYVTLPDFIIDKWNRGIISNTHLSDILRLELLIKYGGLWLDATTFITGEIPSYIYDSDLFLYRLSDANDKAIRYNSWLMYAIPDNRVLKMARDLLYEYWQRENKLREYFLLHLFITMIFEKYPKDFEKMFRVSDSDSNILYLNYFYEPYYDKTYQDIIKTTSIHKLTYKDLDNTTPNTFYRHIIECEI